MQTLFACRKLPLRSLSRVNYNRDYSKPISPHEERNSESCHRGELPRLLHDCLRVSHDKNMMPVSKLTTF
ncbi:hypothetical protein Y032_0088g2158 [Ancylostoma ceylanicum]|uniref:Uncharacterized protein n=1 Tax=Ancylostoma ceylanicum TaxID=53326 RepID=A0A016TMX4_9BILA|nr:hypothetical protein Y032_0088g2158 [Ancylostoma ceylanicum]